MKESEIQKQILDYLALKRIFHYRQNSGAFKRDDHFYRMGAARRAGHHLRHVWPVCRPGDQDHNRPAEREPEAIPEESRSRRRDLLPGAKPR